MVAAATGLAELPGVDPEKDIDVTVSGGVLTIKAEKHEAMEGKHRSESRYGTFVRSISLPEGADADHIQATYDNGVLEVTASLREKADEKSQRRIPVMLNKHIDPSRPASGGPEPDRPPTDGRFGAEQAGSRDLRDFWPLCA